MIRFDGITIYRPARRIRNLDRACTLSPKLFPFACALLLAGPKSTRELYRIIHRRPSYRAAEIVSTEVIPPLRIQLGRIGIGIQSRREPDGKRYWAALEKRETQLEAAE